MLELGVKFNYKQTLKRNFVDFWVSETPQNITYDYYNNEQIK